MTTPFQTAIETITKEYADLAALLTRQQAEHEDVVEALRNEIARLDARVRELEAQLPAPPTSRPIDFFVNPTPTGKGDGSSELDAAGLAQIGTLLAGKPGAVVGLLPGSYAAVTVNLSTGGTPDTPAIIKGLGEHTIRGNRNAGSSKGPFQLPEESPNGELENRIRSVTGDWGAQGPNLFQLLQGCNNIEFRDLNVGFVNYAFRLAGDVEDVTFDGIYGINATDFIYQKYAAGHGCKRLTVRNSHFVGYPKSAIRFNGESDGLLVEDVICDSAFLISGEFAMGIFMTDNAKNITCRRVTTRRHADVNHWSDDGYWNGDGVVANRGVKNVLLEDCFSELNSDGGFDLKSTGTTLVRCLAKWCKDSYRIWAGGLLEDCVSLYPRKFAVASRKGGTGYACDLGWKGGPTPEQPTVITLRRSPMPIIAKSPHDLASAFYGELVVE
jgi:hypothetical protein